MEEEKINKGKLLQYLKSKYKELNSYRTIKQELSSKVNGKCDMYYGFYININKLHYKIVGLYKKAMYKNDEMTDYKEIETCLILIQYLDESRKKTINYDMTIDEEDFIDFLNLINDSEIEQINDEDDLIAEVNSNIRIATIDSILDD
jgi:hypothetical protein